LLKGTRFLDCQPPLEVLVAGATIWCGLAECWSRAISSDSARRRVHGGGLLPERRLLFFVGTRWGASLGVRLDREAMGMEKREA
jgi:hypothetical protein